MKRFINFSLVFAFALLIAVWLAVPLSSQAQCTGTGANFVDENGDGFNDNAPDHDGDGIPNGQDPDYIKAQDGSGKNSENGKAGKTGQKGNRGFVDENGDGINDNARDADGDGVPNGKDADYTGAKKRASRGSRGFIDENGDGINDNALDSDGDGIPNGKDADFVRPQDGSGRKAGKGGFGPGKGDGTSRGDCDGTGPKGRANKGGKG